MCPAERSKVLLEGRVLDGAISVSERKYPTFGKNYVTGLLKGPFTCPEKNFEKNDKSKVYFYQFFWDFGRVVFWFRQKQ